MTFPIPPAARPILNQGAADTACRSLAAQLNPYRASLAATEGDRQ